MGVYMNEKEAATFLLRSVQTLRGWRRDERGPEYYKDELGGIRYKENDLKKWMEPADDDSK